MTSEEIVQSLRILATNLTCEGCAQLEQLDAPDCHQLLASEAANLIERLEQEKAALLESIRGGCTSCKYLSENTIDCKVFDGCTSCKEDCKCRGCEFGNNWEWKGLEDSNGKTDEQA